MLVIPKTRFALFLRLPFGYEFGSSVATRPRRERAIGDKHLLQLLDLQGVLRIEV